MRRAPFVIPALLASLATSCGDGNVMDLPVGGTISASFNPRQEEGVLFRVKVDSLATGLRVRTEEASHDLELYLRRGSPPDLQADLWDVGSASAWMDEDLMLELSDILEEGDWYILALLSPAAAFDLDQPRVTFRITAQALMPTIHSLPVNVVRHAELHRTSGLRTAFRVELPPGWQEGSLRLEAFSPFADVELLAGPESGAATWQRPYGSSLTMRSFERVILNPREVRDTLYMHVYAYAAYETYETIPVTVLAALEGHTIAAALERPEDLSIVPPHEIPPATLNNPSAQAIAATVSIVGPLGGGSGVVVSPDGWVLTNAHVVVGAEEADGELPLVSAGFTMDPARPPVPTLGLELIDVREDLDLALLRITSSIDGFPLPDGLRFPSLPLADRRLPLGSAVTVLGYPMTGGSGSMTSITLTRGVVSGFSLEQEGLVYKTDAAVHSGVSGGACIDDRGQLVGLPSASIADLNEAGGLGYVIPCDRLPDSWLQRIGR